MEKNEANILKRAKFILQLLKQHWELKKYFGIQTI
jgi:hypothetical protein